MAGNVRLSRALAEIGHSALTIRFVHQNVDDETAVKLTDSELSRLGLDTIGDRHKFRAKMRTDPNTATGIDTEHLAASEVASSLLTERNRLFGRHSQIGKKKKKVSKLTGWTGQFVCLASSTTEKIPTVSEKEVLIKAGLGLKKIRLENEDDESEVMKKLMSTDVGFPQLADAGGFELLRSEQNCRNLKVIGSRWNSKELKMYVGSQAKIYIRPVQSNLSTQPINSPLMEEDYKTVCDICSISIPVRKMREHLQECVALPDLSGSIVFTYPNTSLVNSQVTLSEAYGTENTPVAGSVPAGDGSEITGGTFPDTSPVSLQVTLSEAYGTENTSVTGSVPAGEGSEMTGGTFQIPDTYPVNLQVTLQEEYGTENIPDTGSVPAGEGSEMTGRSFHDTSTVNSEVTLQEVNDIENTPVTGSVQRDESSEMTVSGVVDSVVKFCVGHNISNPVEILKKLQKDMVTGRPLEIEDATECLDGATNFILVDRSRPLDTAFDELSSMTPAELRLTLEVQFYGENAEDYGGPRKEFFWLALNAIKEKYFDHGLRHLLADDYVAVGTVFALSILQNGALPNFMDENVLQELWHSETPSPSIIKLRQGLNTLGIMEIVKGLPSMEFLFHASNVPLTVKKLTTILKPVFSENGSNNAVLEKDVYGKFIKYMREVASGRRPGITLNSMLRFVTGAQDEPVLGFQLQPSIYFTEKESFIPTAHTCINRLILPRPSVSMELPEDDKLFQFYDLAFTNEFFGLK